MVIWAISAPPFIIAGLLLLFQGDEWDGWWAIVGGLVVAYVIGTVFVLTRFRQLLREGGAAKESVTEWKHLPQRPWRARACSAAFTFLPHPVDY